jgi:hypothetical protein
VRMNQEMGNLLMLTCVRSLLIELEQLRDLVTQA